MCSFSEWIFSELLQNPSISLIDFLIQMRYFFYKNEPSFWVELMYSSIFSFSCLFRLFSSSPVLFVSFLLLLSILSLVHFWGSVFLPCHLLNVFLCYVNTLQTVKNKSFWNISSCCSYNYFCNLSHILQKNMMVSVKQICASMFLFQ